MNTELMERVRQLIMMRPELHEQSHWLGGSEFSAPIAPITQAAENGEPCGTTACVAGWAALFAAPTDSLIERDSCIEVDGMIRTVQMYAKEQLGLTDAQAGCLFTAENNRDDVLWMLKWLPDHPDATADEIMESCPGEAGVVRHARARAAIPDEIR